VPFSRRRLSVAVAALLAGALPFLGGMLPAGAAPSPASLTVGVGGAAPASAPISGGPITGNGDALGLGTAVAACSPATAAATICETFAVTLAAPAGWTTSHVIGLTATITWDATTTAGLDLLLYDSTGSVLLASNTASITPATLKASHLDPGTYILEVTGDIGIATTYTGTVQATSGPLTPTPSPQIDFAPSSVVSPSLLGAEPQVSFERTRAGSVAGALDPRRGYIDWPLSTRTQIGTLWRTTDGGQSWRQLYDPTCAQRQRPNCLTGGGGDTVNRVNLHDGAVLFGDQEALAAEAYAQSNDHGDSFPVTQQTPVTAAGTGVDRQWISAVDAPGHTAGTGVPYQLEGVYSYHIPIAGEYVSGIDTSGVVHPAAAPAFNLVSQSGNSQIDTTGGPGDGWFYQSYRYAALPATGASGFFVAAAPLSGIESSSSYHIGQVTTDLPQVFPWIALDSAGNAYAVWVAPDGQLYMSYSLIHDKANDPTRGGVPATTWSKKVKVNAPPIGGTVFPEVVAGDPGRIAIAYDATSDYTGVSDGAPPTSRWQTMVSITTDALDPSPQWQTGPVSHRVIHVGSICTSGTTCAATLGDRSLLDMINIATDQDGRVGVVYTNNNNTMAVQQTSQGSEGNPYVMFAKLADGPSLFSSHAAFASAGGPTSFTGDASGDATWPNKLNATNIAGLDLRGDGVYYDGTDVIARIDLTDASAAGMGAALTAYNAAVTSTDLPAQRVQYIARFETGSDVWYLALDQDSSGNRRAYGGKVDATNAITNGTSSVGSTYDPKSGVTVTYKVVGNSLFLRAPMAQLGVSPSSTLYSLTSFSMAGPMDTSVGVAATDGSIINIVREVDSTPPMDAVLASSASQPPVTGPGCTGGCSVPTTGAATPGGLVNTAGSAPGAAAGAAAGLLAAAVALGARRRRRRT
jgi:hypothetical protein